MDIQATELQPLYDIKVERDGAIMLRDHVEICPTCMSFRKGHQIELDMTLGDGIGSVHYTQVHNARTKTSYASGKGASYLLLLVIPAEP